MNELTPELLFWFARYLSVSGMGFATGLLLRRAEHSWSTILAALSFAGYLTIATLNPNQAELAASALTLASGSTIWLLSWLWLWAAGA